MSIEVVIGAAGGSFMLVSGLIVAVYKVPIILTQHTERLNTHEQRIIGHDADIRELRGKYANH